MSNVFLVSGIGGDIGFNICKLLKKYYSQATLIGLDASLESIGRVYTDKFFQVPFASDPNYIGIINEIIQSENVTGFIPMTEQEIKALHLSKTFKFHNLLLTLKKEEALKFLDKYETYKFFNSEGIDAPQTIEYTSNYTGDFPIVIKAKEGRGSQDVHIIESRDQFNTQKYDSSFIIQEYVGTLEDEYTCGVYKSRAGEISSIILKRKLVGDSTGIARVVDDESIEKYVHQIATKIESTGCFNIQLRMSNRGPLCFEINPRISSTVAMRDAVGFHDLHWYIEDFLEKEIDISFENNFSGQLLLRVPEVEIIKESL